MSAFDDFTDTMGGIRESARSAVLGGNLRHSRTAALSRAGIYVLLSAALERYLKDITIEMLMDVGASNAKRCDIKPALLAFISIPRFDAVRSAEADAKRNRNRLPQVWGCRTHLVQQSISTDTVEVSISISPLDGRTPRAYHFETLWSIFALQGDCLPNAPQVYAASIDMLAGLRNQVAHGLERPEVVGRNQSDAELNTLIHRVEDIGEHVALAASQFRDECLYLISNPANT